jgi:hypothetical protein
MMLVEEASNTDIDAAFGFRIEKKVRESLQHDHLLITAHRSDGPHPTYLHELTDAGWRWCRQELAAPVPDRAHRAYRLLYGMAHVMHAHMVRSRLEMVDVFVPGGAPENPPPVAAGEVDTQIRDSYDSLAARPGAWVSLTRLRTALSLPRNDVDDALHRLAMRQLIHLIPESNQKTLTAADRAAAIHIGGEDKHLLSIERG